MAFTPGCASVQQGYDIAVVLGGGAEGHREVQRLQTGRIHAALRLLEAGKVARLHLTGGGTGQRVANAQMLARLARDQGVPDHLMSLETRSLSTLQNALFSRPDLPPDARVVLVTEAFHGWRAWASFVWAGRPADVCASPDPERSWRLRSFILAREVAAWGANIPRAAVWWVSDALGLSHRLPTIFLI